tara:strand:+ start:3180 stop:5936 length:2757 start_codon:yes stop_codon:yes gene_type:complete
MFRNGGPVYMQEGGMAPAPMPTAQGPMSGAMPPQDIEAEATRMAQEQMDPAVMEQMLTGYSQSLGGMQDEGDYASVIDGIRGNSLPMEGRYAELAGLVGPEDAQQTPESVLALVQPTLMLAEAEASGVDEGIGGLAAGIMDTPIEGPMAEGIMSTVGSAGAAPAPMMPPMGGSEPVNFNRGGAVQYFSAGGPVQYFAEGGSPTREQLYADNQAFYQSINNPADQQAALDEQTKMTKAGMLFDIAQGALRFASPTAGSMSTGERLAQSFSPVIGSIGERAAGLSQFKQGQAAENRNMNMMSAQAAQSQYGALMGKTAAPVVNQQSKTYYGPNGESEEVVTNNLAGQERGAVLRDQGYTTAPPKEAAALAKPDYVPVYNKASGAMVEFDTSTPKGVADYRAMMAEGNYTTQAPKGTIEPSYKPIYGANGKVIAQVDINSKNGKSLVDEYAAQGQFLTKPDKVDKPSNLTLAQMFTVKGTDANGKSVSKTGSFTATELAAFQNGLTDVSFSSSTGSEPKTPVIMSFIDPGSPTNVKSVYANSPDGPDQIGQLLKKGFVLSKDAASVKSSTPSLVNLVNTGNPNDVVTVDVSTPDGKERLAQLVGSNYVKGGTMPIAFAKPEGVAFGNDVLAIINNGKLLKGYENGTLTEDEALTVELALNQFTAPKQVFNAQTGSYESQPGGKLPAKWAAADAIRRPQQKIETVVGAERFNEDGTVNFEAFKGDATTIVGGVDLTKGVGFKSGIMRGMNSFMGVLGELGIYTGVAGKEGAMVATASKQLDSLARQTLLLARGGIDGRVFVSDIKMLEKSVDNFKGSTFNSDQEALAQLIASRNEISGAYMGATDILNSPKQYKPEQVTAARTLHGSLQGLLGEYTAAITIFEDTLASRGDSVSPESNVPTMTKSERFLQGASRLNNGGTQR